MTYLFTPPVDAAKSRVVTWNPVPTNAEEIGHEVADRYLHSHHANASEKIVVVSKGVLGDVKHLAIVSKRLKQLLIVHEQR